MTTPLLAAIVEGLTPQERQELVDAIDYMSEHSQSGQPLPELTVSRLINQLSPNVRQRFELVSQMLETPRMRPFDPKLGNDEYAEALGADPQTLANVKRGMDDDAIAAGLQRRMGTDAQMIYDNGDKPLTLREQLRAAHKIHGGG